MRHPESSPHTDRGVMSPVFRRALMLGAVAATCGGISLGVFVSIGSARHTDSRHSGTVASKRAPIVIGAVAALTGADSSIGVVAADGAKLAVSQLNARGGINGHAVQLDLQDDASNPGQAITLLRGFAANRRVALALSLETSAVSVPLAGVANQEKIFLGTVGSTSSKIRAAGPWAMTMSNSESSMMAPLSAYAIGQKLKTVAMVTDVDNAGFVNQSRLFSSALEAHHIRLLANVSTVSTNDAMAPEIAKLESLSPHPQGILLDILANQAGSVIRSYTAAEGRHVTFYGPISLFTPDFMTAAGSSATGTIITSDYGYTTSKAAAGFARAYRAKYGAAASDFAAIGYAAIEYVARRLSHYRPGESRLEVRTSLTAAGRQPTILGGNGFSTTSSKGVISYRSALLTVRGGKFVTVRSQRK